MADIPDFDMRSLNQPVGGVVPVTPIRQVGNDIIPLAAPRAGQYNVPGQRIVEVGEQTIQIVPHPTTNRYPWAPVENPKVPIYQAIPLPPAPTPVLLPPIEPAPAPEPEPVPLPLPPATPPVEVILPPPVTTAPPPPPPVEPVPIPSPAELTIMPVLAEAPASVEVSIPAELNPVPQEVEVSIREPELEGGPEVEVPSVKQDQPEMAEVKYDENGQPIIIYSDYTREVWSVFRPNRLVRLMVLFLILLVIGCLITFWQMSGAPINPMNLPIVKSLVQS